MRDEKRENESEGQPAEPPPEVSAATVWLDPAAQTHRHTHKFERRANTVTVKHRTDP